MQLLTRELQMGVSANFKSKSYAKLIIKYIRSLNFSSSKDYWENRYAQHGSSGGGSYGLLATYKADVLNKFVADHDINTVLELGSGDGNQLSLAQYPSYAGFDVSQTAIEICEKAFDGDNTKHFFLYTPEIFEMNLITNHSDLALSLDVIYHLVEDNVFEQYIDHLFRVADKYVIIYSSDFDSSTEKPSAMPHVKHRKFTTYIDDTIKKWKLIRCIPNKFPPCGDDEKGSLADFYIYQKSEH